MIIFVAIISTEILINILLLLWSKEEMKGLQTKQQKLNKE